MLVQRMVIADKKWLAIICYLVAPCNLRYISDILIGIGCSKHFMRDAVHVLSRPNSGMTYSRLDDKISVVCISRTSSLGQFVNTTSHEIKHLQSHICERYDVDESSEQAAYLVGYISHNIYDFIKKHIQIRL